MITKSKTKYRWYQFSLRALLIFVTVFALACSWLAVQMQNARNQNHALEAIEKLGGVAVYDYEVKASLDKTPNLEKPGPLWLRYILGDNFFANITLVSSNDQAPLTDAALKYIKDMPQIQALYLDTSKVSDLGLKQIQELKQLQTLTLDDQITDVGLEYIKGLTELRSLSLNNTQITDAGLQHIRGLTKLEELYIDNTKITDAGLIHLNKLIHLHYLSLKNTRVSDAGLKNIKMLTQLELLYLNDTQVTQKGIMSIQQELPNLISVQNQKNE